MRLEPELWDALTEIGERERKDLSSLVRKVEEIGHPGGRTSAVRVFVMQYFRRAATDLGHAAAGHGLLPPARSAPIPRSDHIAALMPGSIEETRSAA